jgi:branched-chain amino acid transport system substrate-binding protein
MKNMKTLGSSTRRNIIVGGTAAVSLPLFNIASAQTGNIKIGFPAPLTGAFSAEAQDQVRSAELAIARA